MASDSRPRREFLADRGDARQRLDRVLVRRLADLGISRVEAARWVRAAKIAVNGLPASRPSQRVFRGDRVEVTLPVPARDAPLLLPEPMALVVTHEDDHLLAIDKPAGLVVHPTWGHRHGTVLNGLLWRGAQPDGQAWRPRLVHRLDRGTSGLLLVAKTKAAQSEMARAWQRREVGKEYLALVSGRPAAVRGRIELAIAREPEDPKRRRAGAGGRPSVTSWELVAASSAGGSHVALLRCRPETGRTHQIRVHLAGIGLPLLGDPLYGPATPPVTPPALAAACASLGRQALHAAGLTLLHPIDRRPLRLWSPLPPELCRVAEAAGLDAS